MLSAAAPVLLVALGLAHGRLTNRWGASPELAAAVERLDRVPFTIGGWRGQALELDRRQAEIGQLAGYLVRRYEDPSTGDPVTLMVVCGRPGPIGLHTPDVCYRGIGFAVAGSVGRYAVEGDGVPVPAEFQAARFVKEEAGVSRSLRVLWSWSGDGKWRTPANPRLAYASRPFLYKLYVIREVTGAEEHAQEDSCLEFIKNLLVELDRCLWNET